MSQVTINTIRTLSIDAVQKAKSGHPGAPMGLAPVIYTLYNKILKYDPQNPDWLNRDKFVLSNGHASMLLYATLYLANIKESIRLEDIKNFRQLNSPCAGHPEYNHLNSKGIECTTGPLGQGLGMSVGMALASKWQAEYFNRPNFKIINNKIYSLCGDGCLMEGISYEAASLAGHLKLNNLVWLFDSNQITIEGETNLAFSENIRQRFESSNWSVLEVKDANNILELEKALLVCENSSKPTLIIISSHIGYGSPNKQDKAKAHGEPLGEEEVKLTKKFYDWPENSNFLVPKEALEDFKNNLGSRGQILFSNWSENLKKYKQKYPDLAKDLELLEQNKLPKNWGDNLPIFETNKQSFIASRVSSHKVLNKLAQNIPWLIGGSADLAPSTKTLIEDSGSIESNDFSGRNIHFGIREHAMGAITNGLALSHMRAYCATFFTFSDYLKPAIRLAALMRVKSLFIFTHDSIGLGEDGPTHQPIEHLAALRAVPNLLVLRPADANEVCEAWREALNYNGPTALVLSRQNLSTFSGLRHGERSASLGAKRSNLTALQNPEIATSTTSPRNDGFHSGAYILSENSQNNKNPDVILISTGSEVALCLEAQKLLEQDKLSSRVISMPSWELFEQQNLDYKNKILPKNIRARISVEAGSKLGWDRYVGLSGEIIGLDSFGVSAPADQAFNHFGFTAENIRVKAHEQIKKNSPRQ